MRALARLSLPELVRGRVRGGTSSIRQFMPVIERVLSVSRHWVPSILEVQTDRGLTQLALESEESIRRIGADKLLIRDRRGICFVVEYHSRLDRRSKKLLERFL